MFKKIFLTIIFALFFVGCSTAVLPTDDLTVQDFFPMEYNVSYEYGNSLDNSSSYSVFNTYINDTRMQRRVSSGMGSYVEVIEIKDGALRLIYADPTHYFYEDITNAEPNTNLLLIQEPLVVGNSWEYAIGFISEITSMSTEIETPAGTFATMEVTTTWEDGTIEKNYYAPSIGLVRTIIDGQQMQFETELITFIQDTTLEVIEDFFLYDVVQDEIVVEPRTLILTTNMNYYEMLEEQMRKYTEDQIPLITENTTINGIAVDRIQSLSTIDLNQDFLDEINLGGNIEMFILNAISRTIGSLYLTDQVNITIDGSPYESGHIYSLEGEYFEGQ